MEYLILFALFIGTAIFCVCVGEPLLVPGPLLMAAYMAWYWWKERK